MPKSRSYEMRDKKINDKIKKLSNMDYSFISRKLRQLRGRIKALQEREKLYVKARADCLEGRIAYQKQYRRRSGKDTAYYRKKKQEATQ